MGQTFFTLVQFELANAHQAVGISELGIQFRALFCGRECLRKFPDTVIDHGPFGMI